MIKNYEFYTNTITKYNEKIKHINDYAHNILCVYGM